LDRLPLILLTADRPAELRNIGANQTIIQPGIFSSYTRWEIDLADTGETVDAVSLLSTIDTAVYRALRSPAGPVHINCQFQEPLEPVDTKRISDSLPGIQEWQQSQTPFRTHVRPVVSIDNTTLTRISKQINASSNGLLIVGRLEKVADSKAVRSLSAALGWPLFADIQSGLRLGNEQQITYYDHLLLQKPISENWKPDTVLHFGGVPTCKRLLQFLQKMKPHTYIQFADHPIPLDPIHAVTERIGCDIPTACSQLIPLIKTASQSKLTELQTRNALIEKTIEAAITNEISEPFVARRISKLIPKDHALFLASSMPIRDMDMYAVANGNTVSVAANRGASGIDGTIASACGFAAGHKQSVTLLIGDLALLHDLNSLPLATQSRYPIIIVVINNDGGGIFHFLPIAQATPHFETWFGTPHGLTFKDAASLFKLPYRSPQSHSEFITDYQTAIKQNQSMIIEVKTDRAANIALHRRLQATIAEL
jgi:2-succinyl-5-enolpyruvyl-6-hydroxy-3-cyclohexene-1-carboxylate synthase